jgi:hypothetical protein
MPSAALLRAQLESSLGERLSSTLVLRERYAPLTVPTGIPQLDALTGGLPRGALSEIVGPSSSGRTGVMLAAIAGATGRQEMCALVDASDSFDPASAEAAGVDLNRLLWIRCSEKSQDSPARQTARRRALGRLEQVLKITDLLLQGGGFGMVVLDLGDIDPQSARRVPMTSWFRFRRAVEPTATVLLLVEQEACAKTCASLVVHLEREAICARNSAPISTQPKRWHVMRTEEPDVPPNSIVSHATLLYGMRLRAEVLRSWTQRKPMQSASARFELHTAQ